jgi:hypothetical protein
MVEKKINIDLEVIKKPKIYEICSIEASIYENPLQETISNPSKWQSLKNSFKNKIKRKKS